MRYDFSFPHAILLMSIKYCFAVLYSRIFTGNTSLNETQVPQLPYLFVRCSMFFDDVRITLYFGTFELRIESTLQLDFDFARHCDRLFIASQLRKLVC